MGRRTARELVFKLIYQTEIQRTEIEEQLKTFLEENDVDDKQREYIEDIFNGARENTKEIDANIEKYLKGWKINRISKIDLAILRIAVYELIKRDDIPINVSINEAVELAKKYSSDESAAFINGLLGRFMDSEKIEKNDNEEQG